MMVLLGSVPLGGVVAWRRRKPGEDDAQSVELRVGQARHPAVPPAAAEQRDEIGKLGRGSLRDRAARQHDLPA